MQEISSTRDHVPFHVHVEASNSAVVAAIGGYGQQAGKCKNRVVLHASSPEECRMISINNLSPLLRLEGYPCPSYPIIRAPHEVRHIIRPLSHTFPSRLYMCCFCASICLTMNKLLSRNRSTQFSRHDASPRENLVEMPPVMHLFQPACCQLVRSLCCELDASAHMCW